MPVLPAALLYRRCTAGMPAPGARRQSLTQPASLAELMVPKVCVCSGTFHCAACPTLASTLVHLITSSDYRTNRARVASTRLSYSNRLPVRLCPRMRTHAVRARPNLDATVATPIFLYPFQDCSNPEWKARMDEVGNVFQVHYHSGWVYMAGNAQHLF
jgi:hypothetical protein